MNQPTVSTRPNQQEAKASQDAKQTVPEAYVPKLCPFRSTQGAKTECNKIGCALFIDGACVFVALFKARKS